MSSSQISIGSLSEWLQSLRYTIEPYDECSSSCVMMTNNNNNATIPEQDSYENLWDCSTSNLKFNYGEICRLSFCYQDEHLEDLKVLPVIFDNLNLDIPEDVMLWKKELRYCGEDEEELLESQEFLSNIQDHSDNASGDGSEVEDRNKPKNFPAISSSIDDIDKSVDLRPKSTLQRPARSKTVNFDSSRFHNQKVDDVFEFKSATIIEFGSENEDERSYPIKKTQRLLYDKNKIFIENGDVLRSNVQLRRGAKMLPSKKVVQMLDMNDASYMIHFDTSKDAKHFIEHEHLRLASLMAEKVTITMKLLRFFSKRSSRDLLESKGIIRNETIFGNTLTEVYKTSRGLPAFIKKTVQLIELPDNIKSIGIYRTSGNLAVIQKIRCHVDEQKLDILDQYQNDVDVLTGCLKMFFRELKEYLIPPDVCEDIYAHISNDFSGPLIDHLIHHKLPKANSEVLDFLLTHLAKVCLHKDDNKMDVYNMAVCWGPSLIGISGNCSNIMVQTSKMSKVMEHLIGHYMTKLPDTIDPIPVQINDGALEVIKKLTELIEMNLKAEGIYRKSGSTTNIDKLIKKIEKGKLNELKWKDDVHDLCCVLKRYLTNHLSEPIIPKEYFDRFCMNCDNSTSDHSNRMKRKKTFEIVQSLPRYNCLLLLIFHLRKVAESSNLNKMTCSQLASLFTLTLIPTAYKQNKDKKEQFKNFLLDLLENFHERSHGDDDDDDGDVSSSDPPRFSTYDNTDNDEVTLAKLL